MYLSNRIVEKIISFRYCVGERKTVPLHLQIRDVYRSASDIHYLLRARCYARCHSENKGKSFGLLVFKGKKMIGNNIHIDASTSKRWVRKSANPLFFVNNSEHRSLLKNSPLHPPEGGTF